MRDRRCAAATEFDIETASRIDTDRALRLVLAYLHDDDRAKDAAEREIGACPDCLRAVVNYLAGAL